MGSNMQLNIFEKVLSIVFKKYTYKIYRAGVRDGFSWYNCTLTVQKDYTTNKKP